MKDLLKRQKTLINLITRVGGQKNIQKWMDELLKIDWKLETKVRKMFKINVTELHQAIQKKLAKLVGGKLTKGFITTSTDPDSLDWEELEIQIYGDIDTDSDRLIECVSWRPEAPKADDTLKSAIISGFNSLDDWNKYQTNGAWGFFGDSSISNGIAVYTFGLTREYCGQKFEATGNSKQFAAYQQMDGFGFADSVDKQVYTNWEYRHSDGTTIWVDENLTSYTIPTEKEIVARLQTLIYEHCKRGNLSWEDFVLKIEARKQQNKADAEVAKAREEAAKTAIAEPEWVKEELWNKSLRNFWIGDDYKYSFWWNSNDGTVWEECDDRTRGLEGRTRNTKSLGSDRETVVAYIKGLYAQRELAIAKYKQLQEQYEFYKKEQQAKKGLVKSFEKWLTTIA